MTLIWLQKPVIGNICLRKLMRKNASVAEPAFLFVRRRQLSFGKTIILEKTKIRKELLQYVWIGAKDAGFAQSNVQ